MMAMNPSEIRNPPNGVLGPHGPNPDAKVSANATIPITKEMAPPVAKFFTLLICQDLSDISADPTSRLLLSTFN